MNNTLDMKHNDFQKKYSQNRIIINKLKNKNKILKKKLKIKSYIEQQLNILDEIKNNKDRIKSLIKEEQSYYNKNSKDIFEYFEKKKDISKDCNKKHLVHDFFNKKSNDTTMQNNDTSNNININIVNYFNNTDLYKYDNYYIYKDDICNSCNVGELIEQNNEGLKICNKCGNSIKYIVQNIKPSYKDPPKDVSFYAYKRINHFREILAQFQAKESTTIAPEIIERIKKQIEKERISYKELTNQRTKELLKKLGYNKYYEHISFIKEKLGIQPPVMSSALEETLCNLFIEIQAPYSKYCPKDRVNFLNYYYTIYKLCEMLNFKSFLPYFPMLKDREKIIEQDIIWKKICNELNWNYIHTV